MMIICKLVNLQKIYKNRIVRINKDINVSYVAVILFLIMDKSIQRQQSREQLSL